VHGHVDADGIADFTILVFGLVTFRASDFSL
jgi:hypothetical protein